MAWPWILLALPVVGFVGYHFAIGLVQDGNDTITKVEMGLANVRDGQSARRLVAESDFRK